jgi:hypothetical protein
MVVEIKEDKIGRTCDMHAEMTSAITIFFRKPQTRRQFERTGSRR